MNDQDIFVAESPLGYTVSCSEHQWKTHIEPGHSELENRESDVRDAVKNPYKVFQDSTNAERHIHYSQPIITSNREKYVKVVTGTSALRYNEHTVITAFDVPKIKESRGGGVMIYGSDPN